MASDHDLVQRLENKIKNGNILLTQKKHCRIDTVFQT